MNKREVGRNRGELGIGVPGLENKLEAKGKKSNKEPRG